LADISKINAVALANIAKLDAVLAANLAKVNGLLFASAPAIAAPAAAYSVRLLDTAVGVPTYTGAAMRVRRDTGGTGDDDEADIAFDTSITDPTISLDSAISNASTGVTATTLGQFLNVGTVNGTTYTNPDSLTVTASCLVDTWYDQAGSNDAEQTTQGSQPQIHNGTVNTDLIQENGKPAVSFDGTNDGLNCSTNLRTSTGASTVIQVRNVPQPTTQGAIINYFAFYKVQRQLSGKLGTPAYANIAITTNETANAFIKFENADLTGQLLHFATWDGSTQSNGVDEVILYEDGAQEAGTSSTITTGVTPSGTNSIGFRNDLSSQFCDGTFQEVIVYLDDQSSNRTAIEGNVNAHYQIGNFGTPTSGLLATYTGAAAAYSVRQLANTAALSMRVREDATDTETNIGFDANGALDTAAIAAHCGTANGYVVNWFDQAGSQNDATQSTLASQPQIYNGTAVNTVNGKPGMSATSTTQQLVTSNSLTTTSDGDATVAAVFYQDSGENVSPNIVFGQHGGAAIVQWMKLKDTELQSIYRDTTGSIRTLDLNVSYTNAAQQLGVLRFNGTSGELHVNNTSSSGTILGSPENKSAPVTVTGRAGQEAMIGTIQEVIFYNSAKDYVSGLKSNINSEYLIYQPTDAPTSGLLATYTGAAAAYSVRQLANTAVMSMRVRRDSDDVEQNFGFDSNGDLDTAGIASFCGTANGYVTRWWDQSTNGNHADQATDASQPQIYNGTAVITENGKPILYAANGNVSLSNGLAGNANAYVFSVVDIHITAVLLSDQGQTDWYMAARSGIGNTAHNNITISNLYKNGNSVTYTSQNDAWVGMNQDQSLITGDINTSVVSNYTLGYTSTASYGAYDYQELIIYHSDQSTNRTGIETDINTYFSIY
jgi:hypothetical protein